MHIQLPKIGASLKFSAALRFLSFGLPLLVVTFAVLMGGAALSRGLGDDSAARIMAGIACAAAVAIVVDVILLVGLLGLRATMQNEHREMRWQMIQQKRNRGWGRGRRGGRERARDRGGKDHHDDRHDEDWD